jgi:hypothetical protein
MHLNFSLNIFAASDNRCDAWNSPSAAMTFDRAPFLLRPVWPWHAAFPGQVNLLYFDIRNFTPLGSVFVS